MTQEFIKRILSSIILIFLSLFFIIKGSFYFIFFLLICFVACIYEWYQMNKKNNYFFYGILFLIFSFYTVYDLRNNDDLRFFLLIVVICVSTDIGGYIFGKIFKGPKLTKISPNKTYAGMFGGFFLTIIFSHIFFNNFNLLRLGDSVNSVEHFFVIVLLTSFVSQVGDLIISFFKRKAKIKNTGKIIPGHGGLLDRIDGMVFAFPFIYIITKFL